MFVCRDISNWEFHHLNPCSIHVCRDLLVRNVMDILQAIAFLRRDLSNDIYGILTYIRTSAFAFDYSVQRIVFNETLSSDEVTRKQMEGIFYKWLCNLTNASRTYMQTLALEICFQET